MREAFEDAQSGASLMASADLAGEVDGAQQVINAASAVQALRVAQYAGREEEQDASGAWVDVDHGVGHVSEFAADCFGPALSMGHVAAGRKVEAAAMLASKLPATLAAMSAGDLDPWRATIIATQLAEAGAASCAAVEALIYPKILDHTPGEVTKKVRRVLGRVDADALRVKAAKERLDRFVRAYPSEVPGLTTWVASLPAAESAACWAGIDALAHQMHGADPTRTLGQCRADALVDLMLTNVQVATTVTVMIPVQTMTVDEPDDSLERDLIVRASASGTGTATGTGTGTGTANPGRDGGTANPSRDAGTPTPDDGASLAGTPHDGTRSRLLDNPFTETDDFGQPVPAPNPFVQPSWQQICAMGFEIPGIGVIGGDIAAAILDRFDTRIARVLLDERTGVVIETTLNTYLPNAAMRRFVQNRDGTCRFPGCARNAKRWEPDHVIPHSRGGPTTPWNLASLCKHHHRVKHQAGWALAMTREGRCIWTDPFGRQYATDPINHHELAA